MTEPMTPDRLAEILWDARKVSLGDRDDGQPFGEASARIQEQYRRFAAEVAKRIDQDRDVELERLRARLVQEEEGTWEAIAEAERIRAMYADLKANATEIERQRDHLVQKVRRVEALRDRWEAATRDPSAYGSGGVVHAAALAASHLPDLCRALDGTEADRA